MAPKKLLKRDVDAAHDAWAASKSKFGGDDQATIRLKGRYMDLVTEWEIQNQRNYSYGRGKGVDLPGGGKAGAKFSEGGRPTYRAAFQEAFASGRDVDTPYGRVQVYWDGGSGKWHASKDGAPYEIADSLDELKEKLGEGSSAQKPPREKPTIDDIKARPKSDVNPITPAAKPATPAEPSAPKKQSTVQVLEDMQKKAEAEAAPASGPKYPIKVRNKELAWNFDMDSESAALAHYYGVDLNGETFTINSPEAARAFDGFAELHFDTADDRRSIRGEEGAEARRLYKSIGNTRERVRAAATDMPKELPHTGGGYEAEADIIDRVRKSGERYTGAASTASEVKSDVHPITPEKVVHPDDPPPASTLDPVAPKGPKTPKPKKISPWTTAPDGTEYRVVNEGGVYRAIDRNGESLVSGASREQVLTRMGAHHAAPKAAPKVTAPKKGGGIYSMDLSPLSPAPTVAPEQGTLPLNLPENPTAPAAPAAPAPRPRANPFDPTALPKIQTQADLLEALYQAPQVHTGLMGDAGAIGQQRALSDPFPRIGPNAVPSDLPLPRRYGPAGPIPKPPWVPPALNAGPPPPAAGPAIPMGPSPLPQRTPPQFRLPQRDPNAAFQNEALRRLDLRAGDSPDLLNAGRINLGGYRQPKYPVGSVADFGAHDFRDHITGTFAQPSNASAGLSPNTYFDGDPFNPGPGSPTNSMRGMNYANPEIKVGLSDVPGLARGIRNYTSPVSQAVGNFHANTLGPNARLVNPGSLIDRGAQKLPFTDFFNRTVPKETGWGSGKLGTTLRAGARNFTGGMATGFASQLGADLMGADTHSMMADNAKGSGYRAVQGGLGATAFAGFGSPVAAAAVLPGAALGTLGAEALHKRFGWGEAGNITPTDVLSGDNMKREAEVAFGGITDNAMREARGEDVNGNQISGEQALQAKIEATIGERNKLTQDYNNSTNLLWTDMKVNPAAAADASAANQLEVAQVQMEDYRERVKQRMGVTGETFEQAAQNTEMRNAEDIRTALAEPDRQILDDTGKETGVTYGQWLEQSKGQLSTSESEPIMQEHYTLDRFRDLAKDAGVYEPYLDEQINQTRDQIRLDAISIANSTKPVLIEMGSETDPMTGTQKPSYMGRDGNPTTNENDAISWQEAAQQAGVPVDQYYASKNELLAYEAFVSELPNMYQAGRQSAHDTFQRNALMAQLNQWVPGLMAPYGAIQQYTGNFSDPNQAAAWNNLAALKQQAFQTQLTSGPILAQMQAEQERRDMMPGGAGYQAQVDQRALQYLIQQEAEQQAIANGWYVPKPEAQGFDITNLQPTG